MVSLLAIAPMVTGFPQLSSPARAHPVKSQVHKVGFTKSSVAAMRTARDATRSVVSTPGAPDPITKARAVAVTPVQDVAGAVTVVGVTWPKSATPTKHEYQIRTSTGIGWSHWQPLGVLDGGPDSAEAAGTATGGTAPYVVTGASQYEVRSLTTNATVSDATVQVVDPGTSSADNVAPAPGAAQAATVRPAISTRAEWGADETLRQGKIPAYGQLLLGIVHHTADSSTSSANDYTAEQVPAMIRGMYAYHVQTLGWDDIGYNFLIDRFGRTWEGRSGGMDKAVVGAHALSYNPVSTGVAAIGNFDVGAVPQALTDAFKRIFAWKFSLAGIPASGASPVLASDGQTPLQRVIGHSDAVATLCPGQDLYGKLPEIRAGADAILAMPAVSSSPGLFSPGDFTGDGKADVLGATSGGDLFLYRGNGLGAFVRSGTKIGAGWAIFVNVFSPGDFTGDGKSDLLAVKSNGELYLYRGNGLGGFTGSGTKIGAGWGAFVNVFSPGDFTGDGKSDVLAVNSMGEVFVYRGNGLGGFSGSGTKISVGWYIFTKVFSPRDFTGDGKSDLLAVKSNGELYLYRGNGLGGFSGAGIKIGAGWATFVRLVSPGDFTSDHRSDLLAVNSIGELYLYRGNGLGGFSGSRTRIGSGWGLFA